MGDARQPLEPPERVPGSSGQPAVYREQGNLSYWLAPHAIGPILVNGREIIRRIFVTVRNSEWQEIAPDEAGLEEPAPGQATLRARYSSPLIDFEWEGRFELDSEERQISFGFDGIVPRDGSICRLGLIVLLPPAVATGATGGIVTPEGRVAYAIPDLLGPQPIVDGWPAGLTAPFRQIELFARDGTRLDLAFEGDLFEIEDQRNWGDASYKIYCTPLATGFPRKVAAGQRIAHRVTARFDVPPSPRPHPTMLAEPRPFPAIGVEDRSKFLTGIAWAHVASALDIVDDDIDDVEVGPALEVRLDPAALAHPRAVEDRLRALRGRVARILLEGVETEPPTIEAIRLLKLIAREASLSVPVLTATTGYFVEYNRGRSPAAGADGLAWPLAPTVHSADLDTVFENVTPFGAPARFARSLDVKAHHAIAPLAWTYPARTPIDASADDVLLWLTVVLIDAAAAGIESITLSAELADHLTGSETTRGMLADLVALGGRPVRPLDTSTDGVAAMRIEDSGEWIATNTGRAGRALPVPEDACVEATDDGWPARRESGSEIPIPARSFQRVTLDAADGALA